MAATLSYMLELGSTAPNFNLFNPVLNKQQSLDELKSDKATVVAFICNHCPYVLHINEKFVEVSEKYMKLGISFIGINSNDPINYPADSPENMIIHANKSGYKFSYLFDESQEAAVNYKAACTPDLYVFDKEMKLVYRGQFDSSRPNNGIPVTGEDLTDALDAILTDNPVNPDQKQSIGCNIKWKK